MKNLLKSLSPLLLFMAATLWSVDGKAQQPNKSTMKLGEKLLEGQKLVSANGSYQLRENKEGDFVIEEVKGGRIIYTFPLAGPINNPPSVSYLSYNPDGNICIDSKQNKGYCATNGMDGVAPVILNKSDHAELTDDGRFMLMGKNGQEIWGTPKGQVAATGGSIRFINETTADGLGGNYAVGVYTVGSTIYVATDNGISISTNGGR